MKHPLITMSLMAALAGVPALAQETESPDQQPQAPASETPTGQAPATEAPGTQTPAAERPIVGGALDLGEENASSQPQSYIKATFDDWSLQCIKVQDGEEICQMYQLLEDQAGASVAEASIFKLENGGQAVAGGTFVVPLETLLTEKLTIAVDGGEARRYDYSFCNPIGCYARVGFTQADIDRFRAGAVARVRIVPALAPDQEVVVEMSLAGFTAAYDAASSLQR
ncbi:invasion associated locus B family protein [Citreimonas salinaria]|uniref:Invasion protein IalB, involved in pathogenesis n=1 Tax=Citreimonas salinaria TaxID=321339 RepID=A0A1H3GG42_9RHOB|nr:invasion associated locus B family protein [Citreimonas salinaria]SDY02322.1 Invasion protein IalB, involved in pathogenesis [Citreimonas salinaria]